MDIKQSWKTMGKILLVFFGGMAIIFASFALRGFPYPTEPVAHLAWVELAFLLILLGIPLFR